MLKYVWQECATNWVNARCSTVLQLSSSTHSGEEWQHCFTCSSASWGIQSHVWDWLGGTYKSLVVSCKQFTREENRRPGEMLTKCLFLFFIVSLALLRVKVSSFVFPFLPVRRPFHSSRYPNRWNTVIFRWMGYDPHGTDTYSLLILRLRLILNTQPIVFFGICLVWDCEKFPQHFPNWRVEKAPIPILIPHNPCK